MIRVVCAIILFLWAQSALAVSCEDIRYERNSYSVCQVDPAAETIELFLYRNDGVPIGHFDTLQSDLNDQGKRLIFAMNAGMYHTNRAPVGHFVEDGKELMRLLTGASSGNFGLLPNGVFCLRDDRADVFETLQYSKESPDCDFATQSGPMLVIDGELHPRFLPDSTSRYVRNGVGSKADGQTIYFVISNNRVTFHEFGRFFRDYLRVPNALYFDGNISRIYAPELNRNDRGRPMGPIVGVVSQD